MRQSVTEDATLERMLTGRQVADFLHVPICTIRRWTDKGMLKSYRVGPQGDRRFRREDVLRFLVESSRELEIGAAAERVAVSRSTDTLSIVSGEVTLAGESKSITK
jgi:excisionase family DNA binding protein